MLGMAMPQTNSVRCLAAFPYGALKGRTNADKLNSKVEEGAKAGS